MARMLPLSATVRVPANRIGMIGYRVRGGGGGPCPVPVPAATVGQGGGGGGGVDLAAHLAGA